MGYKAQSTNFFQESEILGIGPVYGLQSIDHRPKVAEMKSR